MHIENALLVARDGVTGDRATLPRRLMLTVGYECLTVADAAHEPLRVPTDWPLLSPDTEPLPLSVPGRTPLPGTAWVLQAALLPPDELPSDWDANTDPWQAFLDAARAGPELWLRTRQPGDRFQPLGMDGRTVKLSDFLTNRKVPRALRDHLPLLDSPSGVLWLCGHRLAATARIQDDTSQVLRLRFLCQATSTL